MISKFGSVAVISLLAVVALSQKVEDRAGGWTYTPPKGFVRNDTQQQTSKGNLVFIGPRDHDYVVSILVASVSVGKSTAKSLGAEAIRQARTDKSVNLVSESSLKVNNNEGYTWRLTRKQPNGVTVGQRQVIFVLDDKGVVMTLSAPSETMDAWDKTFSASLKNFSWTRRAAEAPICWQISKPIF